MEKDDLIPVEDICRHYSVEFSFVSDLDDFALLELVKLEQVQYLRKSQLNDFEKYLRWHDELEVNLPAMDVIVHLLNKIDRLQAEVNVLKSRADLHFPEDFSA